MLVFSIKKDGKKTFFYSKATATNTEVITCRKANKVGQKGAEKIKIVRKVRRESVHPHVLQDRLSAGPPDTP